MEAGTTEYSKLEFESLDGRRTVEVILRIPDGRSDVIGSIAFNKSVHAWYVLETLFDNCVFCTNGRRITREELATYLREASYRASKYLST